MSNLEIFLNNKFDLESRIFITWFMAIYFFYGFDLRAV